MPARPQSDYAKDTLGQQQRQRSRRARRRWQRPCRTIRSARCWLPAASALRCGTVDDAASRAARRRAGGITASGLAVIPGARVRREPGIQKLSEMMTTNSGCAFRALRIFRVNVKTTLSAQTSRRERRRSSDIRRRARDGRAEPVAALAVELPAGGRRCCHQKPEKIACRRRARLYRANQLLDHRLRRRSRRSGHCSIRLCRRHRGISLDLFSADLAARPGEIIGAAGGRRQRLALDQRARRQRIDGGRP